MLRVGFDIDEVLSATAASWALHMQEHFGNPENLSPFEVMERYGIVQNVPYWQGPDVDKWIAEKIVCNKTYLRAIPFPGALETINRLTGKIKIEAYLTARPESSHSATSKWLKEHKFPEAEVFCRPNEITLCRRNNWKANLIHSLYPRIEAFVDDQLALSKNLPEDYKGTLYVLGPEANENSTSNPDHTVFCDTWETFEAILTETL